MTRRPRRLAARVWAAAADLVVPAAALEVLARRPAWPAWPDPLRRARIRR